MGELLQFSIFTDASKNKHRTRGYICNYYIIVFISILLKYKHEELDTKATGGIYGCLNLCPHPSK